MHTFIQLVEGKRVRHPYTGELLVEGRVYPVDLVQFWAKRIQCGDVKVVEKPGEPAKPEKKKKES